MYIVLNLTLSDQSRILYSQFKNLFELPSMTSVSLTNCFIIFVEEDNNQEVPRDIVVVLDSSSLHLLNILADQLA